MPRVSSKVASFTESVIREMTRLALDQYAITWGAKCFRDAIAAKVERTYPGWVVDPERELTVTCGATEGVVASCLALLDPGDEVVVFEPWDVYIITDGIYEHLQFVGYGGHIPPATVAGLEDRTIAVNALSKTYAVTGWRGGWVIAQPAATNAIRKVHDFLTVGAAAPLQEGGVAAMNLPASYYEQLNEGYR